MNKIGCELIGCCANFLWHTAYDPKFILNETETFILPSKSLDTEQTGRLSGKRGVGTS